jgi:hypothetical protein
VRQQLKFCAILEEMLGQSAADASMQRWVAHPHNGAVLDTGSGRDNSIRNALGRSDALAVILNLDTKLP